MKITCGTIKRQWILRRSGPRAAGEPGSRYRRPGGRQPTPSTATPVRKVAEQVAGGAATRTRIRRIAAASSATLCMQVRLESPRTHEARHEIVSHRASSCPSWARTRTLLIQSSRVGACLEDTMSASGDLPSIGALTVGAKCPDQSGETLAKCLQRVLVESSERVSVESAHRQVLSLGCRE